MLYTITKRIFNEEIVNTIEADQLEAIDDGPYKFFKDGKLIGEVNKTEDISISIMVSKQ